MEPKMAIREKSVRQSLAFSTPQPKPKTSRHTRHSLSNLDTNGSDTDAKEDLFATLMNDPLKKAFVSQFLSYNRKGCKDIIELMKLRAAMQEQQSPKKPVYLSPMSVHRKKALAVMQAMEERSSSSSPLTKVYPRSSLPFDKLLAEVIAYVEINSNDQDRSAGVKALLKAMGARVVEKICIGITHAIIKDVPYETYRKANLAKAHLVSVLWLEAVRKNHCKVPEKHYPALGPEAHNSNISVLCEKLQKDYAAVVRDELERSRNLQRTINLNLSSMFSEDVINTSQDCDVNSIISGVRRVSEKSKEQKDVSSCRSETGLPETFYDAKSDMDSVNGQTGSNLSLTESCGAIEHSAIDSISDKLRDFSNSSSSPSVESACPGVRKRQRSSKKENRKTNINISKRKSRSVQKNKESQVLDVLSELQVSNRKSPRNYSHNLSVKKTNEVDLVELVSDLTPKKTSTESNPLSSLQISTESKKDQPGVSESMQSLRISSGSSKQKTAESSALSSLRISTDSCMSKKLTADANLSKEVSDLNLGNESGSDEKTPPRDAQKTDIYVTQRKKRRVVPESPSSDDSIVESSSPEEANKKVEKPQKRKSCNPIANLQIQVKLQNSDDSKVQSTSHEEVDKKVEKPQKRKLYNPNDPDNLRIQMRLHEEENASKKNVEIAPVLMTEGVKKIIQKKLPDVISLDDKNVSTIKRPSSSKKTKPLPDHQFKTPVKSDKVKKSKTEVKTPVTPSRRSMRINSSGTEPVNYALTQRNRRSTLDFLPKSTIRTPIKSKNTQVKVEKKLTSIVCSRFHREDTQVFMQIVRKLGTFFTEEEVTEKTSHLVLAEPKRTINVLRALARGCWILKSEWLYKSLDEEKWLAEENYEMTEFSLAVQKSRQERQAFGRSYSMDIFSNCGNIYVARSSNPRCSDLQELVKICKGRVTTITRNAAVIIGEYVKSEAKCVSENWLLDSIMYYKVQSFKKYLLPLPPKMRRISEEH